MAMNNKQKRSVSEVTRGDKNRFPKGKYQTPSFFEVKTTEGVKRIEHMPDVYPEMRGKPPIINIS